jgi:hypothetical protein
MPTKIFRDRLKNDIAYAIREARNAAEITHRGFPCFGGWEKPQLSQFTSPDTAGRRRVALSL